MTTALDKAVKRVEAEISFWVTIHGFTMAHVEASDLRLILNALREQGEALRGIQFAGPRHRCVECGGQPVTGHVNNCRVGAALTRSEAQ